MQILTFQGGLGNQLYQYSYYLYQKSIKPSRKIYGFYPRMELSGHNGLEINKWFDVQLPHSTWYSNLIGNLLVRINRVENRLGVYTSLIDCGKCHSEKAVLKYNYYQDAKYYKPNTILFSDYARQGVLVKNSKNLEMIRNSNSVCIHLRFGDYLSENGKLVYGGICTSEYYQKAIEVIKSHYSNPVFFVFSDNPEKVSGVVDIENMSVIDCNKGKDSFYDMYLMSHCKAMILANSTFSCWAAYLNTNADLIVTPSQLINIPPYNAQALQEYWIKINRYGEILP